MTADEYAYWRQALAGRFGPVHANDPRPGFYRQRLIGPRDEFWTPVAIWRDESGLVALKHAYIVEQPLTVPAEDIWTFCCEHPITEEAYRAVAERKQPWPSGSFVNRDSG